jgi:hypothetical protein
MYRMAITRLVAAIVPRVGGSGENKYARHKRNEDGDFRNGQHASSGRTSPHLSMLTRHRRLFVRKD